MSCRHQYRKIFSKTSNLNSTRVHEVVTVVIGGNNVFLTVVFELTMFIAIVDDLIAFSAIVDDLIVLIAILELIIAFIAVDEFAKLVIAVVLFANSVIKSEFEAISLNMLVHFVPLAPAYIDS
jgi:hypothetical protein